MDSFEGRLIHLLSRDYPTPVGKDFIEALFVDLRDRRYRVSALVADYVNDPKGAEDQLRSEHRKFVLRFPFLDALENAQTQRVAWSLAPSIESFARHLFPGKHLLTSSDSAYNYSVQFWTQAATGNLTNFYILRLPSLHRLDAFLHVLIGHELYHPILSSFFDAAQSSVLGELRDKCSQLLKNQPQLGPLFDAKRLDRVLEVTRTIWRRALEELMCDMGCAVLFGPAAVLALLTFALTSNLDAMPASPGFYPPFRFRLRTIMRYAFGAEGYGADLDRLTGALSGDGELAETASVFMDHWNQLTSAIASSDDLAAIDTDALTKIAYSEVHSHLSDAWMFIKNLVLLCHKSLAFSGRPVAMNHHGKAGGGGGAVGEVFRGIGGGHRARGQSSAVAGIREGLAAARRAQEHRTHGGED